MGDLPMLAPAIRNRLADTDSAIRSIRFDIANSIAYHSLPKHLQGFIDDQLYGEFQIDSRTPSSVLTARRASAVALQEAVRRFFDDHNADEPEPFLVTFAYRAGEVAPGHPLQNVQTSIQVGKAALSKHEMDGILTPDVEFRLPWGERNLVMPFHLHGIVFSMRSSRRKLRLQHTARKLDEDIGLPSRMTRGSYLSGKLKGEFLTRAEKMATYAGKIVAAIKIEAKDKDGELICDRERVFFTPRNAFELLHSWSQIPVWESVIPVGPLGEELHRAWHERLQAASFRDASGFAFAANEAGELWHEVMSIVNSGARSGLALSAI